MAGTEAQASSASSPHSQSGSEYNEMNLATAIHILHQRQGRGLSEAEVYALRVIEHHIPVDNSVLKQFGNGIAFSSSTEGHSQITSKVPQTLPSPSMSETCKKGNENLQQPIDKDTEEDLIGMDDPKTATAQSPLFSEHYELLRQENASKPPAERSKSSLSSDPTGSETGMEIGWNTALTGCETAQMKGGPTQR